jgi:hypothetical protein
MFSLLPVEFRGSSIAGRGVFARRPFKPGDMVIAYAPKQRKVEVTHPDAVAAAKTKITLLSEDGSVIIPDTRVPGGWLCNHSCDPNATIHASGLGRIQCTKAISPGREVTIFYGWVSINDPRRDPCHCGSPRCRGFINFDLSDEDVDAARVVDDRYVGPEGRFRERLLEYEEFLRSIGQEHVSETIVDVLVRMKRRRVVR